MSDPKSQIPSLRFLKKKYLYCLSPFNKIECLSPCIGGHKGVKIKKSNFETPTFEKKHYLLNYINMGIIFTTIKQGLPI